MASGGSYLVQAGLREAVQLAQELEERGASLGGEYQLIAKRALAASYFFRGEFRTGREHALAGIELDKTTADSGTLGVLRAEVAVTCRSYGVLALWFLGDPATARTESDEAVELAQGRSPGKPPAHTRSPWHCSSTVGSARSGETWSGSCTSPRSYGAYRTTRTGPLDGRSDVPARVGPVPGGPP